MQEVAEEIIEKNWQMGVVHHLSGAVRNAGKIMGLHRIYVDKAQKIQNTPECK